MTSGIYDIKNKEIEIGDKLEVVMYDWKAPHKVIVRHLGTCIFKRGAYGVEDNYKRFTPFASMNERNIKFEVLY